MAALPAIAMIASVVGTAGSVLSSVQQARGQAVAAKAEAKSIRQQAEFEEGQFRRKARMVIGKQVAIGAAAGLDVSGGSPLFMELDSIRQAELEALNIRHQGKLGVASKKFEARMARARIPGIILGGAAQLGGSLASSSILGSWMTPSSSASSVSLWSAGRPAPWR